MKKWGKKGMAVFLSAVMLAGSFGFTSVPVLGATDTAGHWAEATINDWVGKGYIKGYPDGTFQPDKAISRAEFVVLMNKAFQISGNTLISFNDVPGDHWAYAEIQKGIARGYVSGYEDGTFRPGSMVTRQEAAVMLAKVKGIDQYPDYATNYGDVSAIPEWSKGYIGGVTRYQIMSGFPNGDFKPGGSMTRAEAVTAVDKATKTIVSNNSQTTPSQVVGTPSSTTGTGTTNNTGGGTTVTPSSKTSTNGDYSIDGSMASLSNRTITGDLIIEKNASASNIRLTDVDVKGTVIVKGGDKITAKDCDFRKVQLDYKDVEFVNDGSKVTDMTVRKNAAISGDEYNTITIDNSSVSSVTIDAPVKRLVVDTETKVKLYENADIALLETTKNSDSTTISMTKGSTVDEMELHDTTRITGRGDIGTMTVYESGVKSEIEPDEIKKKNGASSPRISESSSSSSSGSHSSSGSRYDDLTIDDDRYFDGDGERYDEVTIRRKGAEVEDLIAYGDLTIASAVGDGDVTLINIEVKGDVYVYGGGENSIRFENCDIEGDIISDRDLREGVALKFDEDCTIDGDIIIKGKTILGSYGGSGFAASDVVIEASDTSLETSIDIANLKVNRKSNVTVNGATINNMTVDSNAAGMNIQMKGSNPVITKLYAHGDLSIKGTGTVKTIVKDTNVTVTKDETIKNDSTDNGGGSDTQKPVTGVVLSPKPATVIIGQELQMTATVSPTDAGNKKVKWTSSATETATVSETGLVKGLQLGTVTITATTEDGAKTDTAQVTVIGTDGIVPVETLTVSPKTLNVEVGGTAQLTVAVTPENATFKTATWISSNPDVCQVDQNGLLTGIALGENVTITATSADGTKTDTALVSVVENADRIPAIGITLSETEKVLDKQGDTFQLTATVTPGNTTDTVVWASRSNNIVQVDQTGKVTAVGAGSATVVATAGDFSASCKVTVKLPVSGVKLDRDSLTLNIGKSETLTATLLPEKATNRGVSWKSDDPNIAMVDQNGKVTAIAANYSVDADTVITVTTDEGGFTASCKVTVKKATVKVQSMSFKQTEYSIDVKNPVEYLQLNSELTVLPANADNQNFKWDSSNPNIASVDAFGIVTPVNGGETVITAKAQDGSDKAAACKVTVNVPVRKIEFTSASSVVNRQVAVGSTSVKPSIDFTPTNASNKGIEWTSSDEDVAVVGSDGAVVGKAIGTATITGRSKDLTSTASEADLTVSYKIEVVEKIIAPKSITLSPANIAELNLGETIELTATISPRDATDQGLIWSTQNGRVEINETSGTAVNGVMKITVKGKVVGSDTITVTAENYSVKSVCEITVVDPNAVPEPEPDPTPTTNRLPAEPALNLVCLTPTVTEGGTVQLVMNAYHVKDDTTEPVYQWDTNGKPYTDKKDIAFTKFAGTSEDENTGGELSIKCTKAGTYKLKVTYGGVTSETITFTVLPGIDSKALQKSALPQTVQQPKAKEENNDDSVIERKTDTYRIESDDESKNADSKETTRKKTKASAYKTSRR